MSTARSREPPRAYGRASSRLIHYSHARSLPRSDHSLTWKLVQALEPRFVKPAVRHPGCVPPTIFIARRGEGDSGRGFALNGAVARVLVAQLETRAKSSRSVNRIHGRRAHQQKQTERDRVVAARFINPRYPHESGQLTVHRTLRPLLGRISLHSIPLSFSCLILSRSGCGSKMARSAPPAEAKRGWFDLR